MATRSSLILDHGELQATQFQNLSIENSPSNMTITPLLPQASPSASFIRGMTPRSPTVSRLVSFSSESLGAPFEAGTSPSRIFRTSSPSASLSSSTIHQLDIGLASRSSP